MTAAAKVPISPRLRFVVLARDGFACRYCGHRPPDVALHVDHVVPEALGGLTEPGNLIPACDLCNLGKGPVPLSAFAAADIAVAAAHPFDLAAALEADAASQGTLGYYLARFDREWLRWRSNGGLGEQLPRPTNWALAVARFLLLGLPFGVLVDLIDPAMEASPDPWAYLHGSAWAWLVLEAGMPLGLDPPAVLDALAALSPPLAPRELRALPAPPPRVAP